MRGAVLAAAHCMAVRRHTDLDVWKLADEVRRRIGRLTAVGFDAPDRWWVRDQLRRAADSACANIAEGFARYQPRDFARFMRTSRGSLLEIGEHLKDPIIEGLLPEGDRKELTDVLEHAQRASARLIVYLQHALPPVPRR
jgi:four helix bundle protein